MRFLLVFFTLALPIFVRAQMPIDFSTDLRAEPEPFTVSVSPQYPMPYEKAALSFVSGSVDLANAEITVVVVGKEIYRGNAKPVAVELGRGGVPVTAQIQVRGSGATHTKSVTITPQDVTLILEPIASAHVLYPGKPLPPLEGKIRVVAMAMLRTAAGQAVNPTTVSYQWSVDGVQTASGSGIGKTALTVAAPLQYRQRTVRVTVTSAGGSLVGGASVSFSGSEPNVRIYENDPLLGIRFDRALTGTYAITDAESSLYAGPYSFPNDVDAPLVQWFLNGTLSQTDHSVTLRPTGDGQGSASLSAVVSSGEFSKGTAALTLSFGQRTGFNLFGL